MAEYLANEYWSGFLWLWPLIVMLAQSLLLLVVLLVAIAYILLADRKIWAAVMLRRGPNVVGAFGLLQSFADLLKFVFKESVIPAGANKGVFLLAPLITVTLALGVHQVAKRGAIVKKLSSVETLGSTSVICSDKTGTLTRNEMTVQVIWTSAGEGTMTGVGWNPEGEIRGAEGRLDELPPSFAELLLAGALCNDARVECASGDWRAVGDPTEAALLVAAVAPVDVGGLQDLGPLCDPVEQLLVGGRTGHGGPPTPLSFRRVCVRVGPAGTGSTWGSLGSSLPAPDPKA